MANSDKAGLDMLKPCNLTRNYSIASLVGIGLVAAVLVYLYQAMAVRALIEREGQANSDLATTVSNTIWPKYADYVWMARNTPADELVDQPVIEKINRDILHKVQGLRVVKVKIYDLNGLVVFSTQPSQIGSNKADNAGFQAARGGMVANEMIYRNTFSTYEGNIFDRNLIASYVPVRRSFDQPVEGVFEIYSDVTPMLVDINRTSNQILVAITALMLLLYLFLLVIVRRAHRQLKAYEKERAWEQEKRIDYLEFHEEVTGLLNRKGLLRRMNSYMLQEHTGTVGLGVVAIKLLNLTALSGGIGHQSLMQLLRLAAERARICTAGVQNLSHLDTSEFVMIEENLFSESELDMIVEKLISFFAEPFIVDGKQITLAIAVGVDSSWGGKGCESLLNNALLALSECEVRGKHFLRYDGSMELKRQEYLNLELEISEALQRHEFTLYYQPKINLQSGEVTGMEALARWHHPQRGTVMPTTFIHLLEERGYIVELGQWLLQQACMQCRRWHDAGHDKLRVAVNISIKQLEARGFIDGVALALQQSGLPPHALELELTESILAEDTAVVGELLKQLKGLGVRLSIDDFGTGYSSLSYLLHFPFDDIKIDRSFIRDMMHNHDHAVLTAAIVTMAKSLKLGVVAEGVETAEQLQRVRDLGCDEVQGFHFSQAVAPERFIEVLGEIKTALAEPTRH